jgi:hypothetical protein
MMMNFHKYNIQTLAGMSLDALKTHYDAVKEDYLKLSGRDSRTQAYLMQVNGWIQKLENEVAE